MAKRSRKVSAVIDTRTEQEMIRPARNTAIRKAFAGEINIQSCQHRDRTQYARRDKYPTKY